MVLVFEVLLIKTLSLLPISLITAKFLDLEYLSYSKSAKLTSFSGANELFILLVLRAAICNNKKKYRCAHRGARTLDHKVKSLALYQLS